MVPNWVRPLAEKWGHEIRKFQSKAGNIQGTMGRIRDEGPDGAAIRGAPDYVPKVDLPRQVNKFHRAWTDLDYHEKDILWLQFVEFGKTKDKWAYMGMNKSKYYRTLNASLEKIARVFHFYE